MAEPEPQQQQQQHTKAEPPLEEFKEQRAKKAIPDEDAPCSRRATTEHSTRRSSRNRRNQKEMKITAQRPHAYECTAVDYDFAFAFMVQRRFKGNRKGDRQRRSAPTQRLPKKTRPPKRKVHLTLANELER